MMSPKFTFECTDNIESARHRKYTAELMEGGGTYAITLPDCVGHMFYDEAKVQSLIDRGIWEVIQ